MANSYFAIGLTSSIAEIAAALTAKYSSGVTIHYTNTSYIVFTCPAISNKVIKIYAPGSSNTPYVYYGDAWTSTTTITNQVVFTGYQSGTCSGIQLVLGTNFMFFQAFSSAVVIVTALVGQLSNGHFVCIGGIGTSNAGYTGSTIGKDITENVDAAIITFATIEIGMDADGYLYKRPVRFKRVGGVYELNSDGTFATIDGLETVTYETSNSTYLATADYFMSSTGVFTPNVGWQISTCLYIPL